MAPTTDLPIAQYPQCQEVTVFTDVAQKRYKEMRSHLQDVDVKNLLGYFQLLPGGKVKDTLSGIEAELPFKAAVADAQLLHPFTLGCTFVSKELRCNMQGLPMFPEHTGIDEHKAREVPGVTKGVSPLEQTPPAPATAPPAIAPPAITPAGGSRRPAFPGGSGAAKPP